MTHSVVVWVVVAAFVGAGVVNSLGVAKARENLIRWGYPPWWHLLTGGLEIVVAVLIALHAVRPFGLLLGAAIILAAMITVLRHRDYPHLAPLALFAALLALAWLL